MDVFMGLGVVLGVVLGFILGLINKNILRGILGGALGGGIGPIAGYLAGRIWVDKMSTGPLLEGATGGLFLGAVLGAFVGARFFTSITTDDVGWINGIREAWRRSTWWPRASFTSSMIAACLTLAWTLFYAVAMGSKNGSDPTSQSFAGPALVITFVPIVPFAFIGFTWGCSVYGNSDSSEAARELSRLSIIIAVLAGLFPLALIMIVIGRLIFM